MHVNSSLFVVDPRTAAIPNDGVAKVLEPRTPQEWAVLRHELTTFVCEGEYRAGLERVLGTYLRALGEAVQPAVWVSGFFGSGKSHFVRVLEALWRDVEFPDGARARGLIQLPGELPALFRELQTAATREGGLWSIGGTLGAGANNAVRLAILEILFRGAGLPGHFHQACFTMWLREDNLYEAVRTEVEAQGKRWEHELVHMLVSPCIRRALLKAHPGFASTEAEAGQLLKSQFPPVTDVTDDTMLEVTERVLRSVSIRPGKLPLTLVVLDELQQYLGDNAERMLQVQNVVEAISSRFESKVLVVATGQSALQGGTALSKLQGRFTVNVALSDKDVETVVRQVVLRKKPDAAPLLEDLLNRCSGEIDRHLASTRLGPSSADTLEIKAADYPLLPVRRRFWERVLRAVDRAGTASQLRTQLKVVHEAVREIADQPIGTVVAADRVYHQIAPTLLQTGALSRAVDETIRKQDDGSEDGRLRMRLCALIYLISQLPRDSGADTGLRATSDMLADLLVEDLPSGSAALRGRVPGLLDGMVTSGELMLIGDEYRLQTPEGAEWEQYYRSRVSAYTGDAVRLAADREAAIRAACLAALKDLSLAQGDTKTPRKLELFFSPQAPSTDGDAVPVWIRDEWSVTEAAVRDDARAAGTDGPIIYVYLPKRSADTLTGALAGLAAATETLARPTVHTQEAEEARSGMATRQARLKAEVDSIVEAMLKDARVFQGGGNEVTEDGFRASVAEAMRASLERLYPDFKLGDHAGWDTVKKRVREGSGDALTAVGYQGEPKDHPVCQRVLAYIGAASRKGLEVRKHFAGPPFGWGQDAVDGALLALAASGDLCATFAGTSIRAKDIDQSKLGQTEFRVETSVVTTPQRLAVRGLMTKAEINCQPGSEAAAIPRYIEALKKLADDAGGDAPLPARPSVAKLDIIASQMGNDAVLAVWRERDSLENNRAEWSRLGTLAAERRPQWDQFQRLLKHAEGLAQYAELKAQATSICDHRMLLVEPNPVQPLITRTADALRAALERARSAYADVYSEQMALLAEAPVWRALSQDDRREILAREGIAAPTTPSVGTVWDLLDVLDATPLSTWANKTAALGEQVRRALLEAARRGQPEAVRVTAPSATLASPDDVEAYLAALRAEIMAHIDAGKPVVI